MSKPQNSKSLQQQDHPILENGAAGTPALEEDLHPNGHTSVYPLYPSSAVGMVLQLADGSIQACNAEAEEILGFTLAQMQGCHYINCPWQTIHTNGSPFPGDTHPSMVALRTGQPVINQVMGFYQPSGDLIWLQVNAQPLFQQNTTMPWAVCTTFTPMHPSGDGGVPELRIEDLPTVKETVSPHVVEPLGELQKRYRLLGDAVPAILFTNTPDGRWSYTNQKFYDYTGMVAGSAEDWGWAIALHPDDRERVQREWHNSTEQGKPFEVEYRFRRADGEYRWFVGHSSPIRDQAGEICHWFGVCVDVHNLKVSQEELRRSEGRFRQLADVSMFGVAIGTLEGEMLYANDALLKMIGYSREELETGQISWIDLTPAEYLHLDWQAAEEMRQRGVSTPFEKEYIHKDGHRVPILIGGALVNELGTDEQFVTVFYLDLTKLKQTETFLQEALQKLTFHVENTPMAVIEWDADFTIQRWSGAAPQIFGWQAEEVVGKAIHELNIIYEDDVSIVMEACEKMLLGNEPQLISQNRNYTKNGSVLHCIWYNSTLTDASGRVVSILSLASDVTKQVQAEESLRQSEERFRLAASVVAGMVYDWNVQTGEVYRSEGMFQLVGLRPEAIPPTSSWWAEQIHPDDLVRLAPKWNALCLGEGDSYDLEYRVRHCDGHWVNLWDRGFVIRDRQGKIVRIVGSSTDVTAQKQLDQEREQLLQREQAAREQAEAVSRLKDEFLTAVSHELRTPLTPILGWTGLLQTRPFEPEQTRHALAIIERNARLQAQLVEDLLDISRIMQGKLRLNPAPVSLETVITAALTTVQPAAAAKEIRIHTVFEPTIKPIFGDASRLQQVVWNLLSNAIKFTPSGGVVEVKLSSVTSRSPFTKEVGQIAEKEEPLTQYAQMMVRDNGVGISSEFLPHIFEHFRQQDGATTRKFGGLGLGLAIVKQIVELHGGTIHAESAGIGEGATFIVKLPLLRGEKAPKADYLTLKDSENSASAPSSFGLAGVSVLVIEDDADSRDYLECLLVQEQAIVKVAASASEALQMLAGEQPDILLSDIGMPQMNGYEFLRQVRQQLNLSSERLPAIALTAYTTEYDKQQAINAGFQHHLAKPVEPEELVRAIATLTSNRYTHR